MPKRSATMCKNFTHQSKVISTQYMPEFVNINLLKTNICYGGENHLVISS